MPRLSFSAILAGLLSLGAAMGAAADSGITGELGLGLGYQPHDPTGSSYDTVPLPYMDLEWGDVSLSTDDGLTWSAFKGNGLSAGPYVNYLQGRNSDGKLRGLRDVRDMADIGGFIEYAPDDFWRLFATLGQAVGGAGGQGGLLGKLGGEIGYPLGMGIIGSNELTLHFADDRQANTFYGVSSKESLASGIDRYNAGGGLQNFTLSQSFQFPLGDNWSLVASASWIRLANSAADSSIVRDRGEVNQGQVQTAISYKF
ncbi:MipA/OmpV family protein [Pseudomonas sp. TKO26]|uniref:MipA/OmpV family protein n=1 Tax=unclassified Pseudomonas TaxID=196821 RepID=UPI000D8CCE42|nr:MULTISPECIES: MipA/OmpV family protein [unclassified Pseudomonas]PYY92294.1 MipA/OmpV family protein [Pseudomonas sp. TKO30]PYY94657.1 MipA/OmpV family protein [Pseudomonas sp. TKO29]PYY96530.1 MipA/OmpV family protein [Pseudomonas sp. TKO26]PYZ02122.1 MipA/OmpV family protein [Pseudomonas sp. TKO14]